MIRRLRSTLPLASLFLALAACMASAGAAPAVEPSTTRIAGVAMDFHRLRKWDASNGDTWDPFWADDGDLYAFCCDGWGFGRQERNIVFNRLYGASLESLAGTLVNDMPSYGGSGQRGADGASWKVTGQECIDSVFYTFVSRHVSGRTSGDPLTRQTAANASLIKSTDRGRTWERAEPENLRAPMWPGRRFAAPYFVHYGQNGGRVSYDDADRYVYAVSNNGFWNDGDDFILGRVPREKLPDLRASDWTFHRGGDGRDPANWAASPDEAAPILRLPGRCGTSAPTFIPALNAYLWPVWHNTAPMAKWFQPDEITYDFYQSAHVWGPWTLVSSQSDKVIAAAHMYAPSVCAKFQTKRGGEVEAVLFTGGYPHDNSPGGVYKLWAVPLCLRSTPPAPEATVNDDDPRIRYTGAWRHLEHRGKLDADLHVSGAPGDTLELNFEGTGVSCVAEKTTASGEMDVFLDDVFQEKVDLRLKNFPDLAQVVVWESRSLAPGAHRLKLAAHSERPVGIDAFRVSGAPASK